MCSIGLIAAARDILKKEKEINKNVPFIVAHRHPDHECVRNSAGKKSPFVPQLAMDYPDRRAKRVSRE